MTKKLSRCALLLMLLVGLSWYVNARTINFAGYTWSVKSSNSLVGPGPNYFTGSEDKIWSDMSGLHFTISSSDSHWQCTEVVLDKKLGYGTYLIQAHGRFDLLDKNMIAGFFTYESDTQELDIEFSRWGDLTYPIGQYSVQPVPNTSSNNYHTFTVSQSDADQDLTLIMTWLKGTTKFQTYRGHHYLEALPDSDLIESWTNSSTSVPIAGGENYRINFWLMSGLAPSNNMNSKFTVSDFKYYAPTLKGNTSNLPKNKKKKL